MCGVCLRRGCGRCRELFGYKAFACHVVGLGHVQNLEQCRGDVGEDAVGDVCGVVVGDVDAGHGVE